MILLFSIGAVTVPVTGPLLFAVTMPTIAVMPVCYLMHTVLYRGTKF